MAQEKPSIKTQATRLLAEPAKTVWIENSESTNEHSRKQSNEIDQEFKKQHQHYLAFKLARKQRQRKMMIQQFGQSSSDEDVPMAPFPVKVQKAFLEDDKRLAPKQEEINPSTPQSQKTKHSNKPASTTGKQTEQKNSLKIVINSKKGSENWVEDTITINQNIALISSIECAYYDLNKFKVIFTEVGNGCFKLKINWKNEQFIFGASSKNKYEELPETFYIFAKIISLKLSLMGRKPLSHGDHHKTHGLPEQIIKSSFISGKLIKKSRVISRWSQVLAVINKEGLYYYKKPNEKGDLLVSRGKIEQLWTRFEFQNEFLIVKLFQNGHKIELGIPVEDELAGKRWLYHLYRIIQK